MILSRRARTHTRLSHLNKKSEQRKEFHGNSKQLEREVWACFEA